VAIAAAGLKESRMGKVADRIYEVFRAYGMTKVFGNPGTPELGFLAGMPEDFQYVLGLHEGAVTAMASGYALATGHAAVVNLHALPGVGNAMGMIANASIGQVPLVITAGQQDRRQLRTQPHLSGRLVELTRPYTKWSVEPYRAVDVPEAIAHAYHVAMTAPRGPAFVSIPMDGLDEECPPVMVREVSYRTAPDPTAIAHAAAILQQGKRVAIVAGAQVDTASAYASLVALGERLHAGVFMAPETSRHTFPEDHPLYQGDLPAAMGPLADQLRPYDTVLVAGAPVFHYYLYVPGPVVHPGTAVVQLTNDPAMAARALVGSSVLGDVGLGLRRLLDLLPPGGQSPSPPRSPAPGDGVPPSVPLKPAFVYQELAKVLPARAMLCVETPSSEGLLFDHVRLREPDSYFTAASGSLGFALPAAVGVALSKPDRPVVAIVGDGAVHYAVQGLWTAARRAVPVTFIIMNNREYAVLKRYERFLRLTGVPGLDVPGVDYEGLARGYGLPYRCIAAPEEVQAKLGEAFSAPGPNVVEIVIDPAVPDVAFATPSAA
jgi:benzoylformate decarboxylase